MCINLPDFSSVAVYLSYNSFCFVRTLSVEKLVDSPNAFGMSPLMIAAQKGYTRLVKKAFINNNWMTFL